MLRERIKLQFGEAGEARKRLDKLAADDVLSGAVAVALGNDVLFERAYGMADRANRVLNRVDTRFNLASMGKMFTALAVARLAEKGRLNFQDSVTRYVSGLPGSFGSITIDHLLTHRSGLGNYFGSPIYSRLEREGRTVTDYMLAVLQDQPRFSVGSAYGYSNNGYVLLGAVIESILRKDYFTAVEELVYRPAGMRQTSHTRTDQLGRNDARGYTKGCFAKPPSQCTPQPNWEPVRGGLRGTPAGGVYSSLPDLLQFSRALRTGRLVRPDTLKLMTRRHVDELPPGGPIDGYGYGFGLLRVNGVETFGHNGGTPGATSQLDMVLKPALTTIILTNGDSAQRAVSGILRRALLA